MVVSGVQAQEAVADRVIDAPLLDASHAQRAYRLVEAWLGAEAEDRQGVKPIRVTGLIGVRLVLRNNGIAVGEGEVYREDLLAALDGSGQSIDLLPLLLQVTQLARSTPMSLDSHPQTPSRGSTVQSVRRPHRAPRPKEPSPYAIRIPTQYPH